ncbi:MAG: class I SAM-dependent methyltransferase [Acidimicrobiia bacterium]
MSDQPSESFRFFDEFARFVDTSETGRVAERLNGRYVALIQANRHLIEGARVLDLASHDGRFSFAALKNGAAHVIGIEHDPTLVAKSHDNMDYYRVQPSQYHFITGDVFDCLDDVEHCDVIFCFGLFYHINNHLLLLSKIASAAPRSLIIDTNISRLEPPVIELRNPLGGANPRPGSQLEGYPSKAALDAMLSTFGWTYDYFDWQDSRLAEHQELQDYRNGRRVSAVVNCQTPTAPPHTLEQAVTTVHERQRGISRRKRWKTVVEVATEFGITPQALDVLVRKSEHQTNQSGPTAGLQA